MFAISRITSNLKICSRCWTQLRLINSMEGLEGSKRFGGSLVTFESIDRDYYLNPNNQESLVKNIRFRGLKDLTADLDKCSNDEEVAKLLEANVNNLPNKLDERWTDYTPGSNVEDFIVEEFGNMVLLEEEKVKKDLNLARRLGLVQTSRYDNIGPIGGTRSYAFLGDLARLHQALIDWTLDELINRFEFTPIIVPNIVYEDAIQGCGYRPRGRATQVYKLLGTNRAEGFNKNEERQFDGDICLVGTSEIPLTALHIGETFEADNLPKKYCTVSRCYRAELSKVKSEIGIYRVPYFTKVEMYALTQEDDSNEILFEFLEIQKHLLTQLNFKCRMIDMPPEELGLNASRKFDMEIYFPGKKNWGEVCSASNCTDFQSRRFNIKYRSMDPNYETNEPFKTTFVHTINATACALPRILIGLLEYGQNQDGSIVIPKVLREYMDGQNMMDSKLDIFLR